VSILTAQYLLKYNLPQVFEDLGESEYIQELTAISNETIDIAKERSRKADQEKL
jgi:hypothetical protein